MKPIRFTLHHPRGDRRHFIHEDDVRVLLDRLPEETYARLTAVHFNDRSRGRRYLGYVNQGRREIGICAVPPRVSLSSVIPRKRSPSAFGALRGSQWPVLAIRRFMLYEVFLHELGHLQVIDPEAESTRRKFADETRAEEFAVRWCRELWSKTFDHPDPVHNPPSDDETRMLAEGWRLSSGCYRRAVRYEKVAKHAEAVEHYRRAIQHYDGHSSARERCGILMLAYVGRGADQAVAGAIDLLRGAIRIDPYLSDATLFLATALSQQGREAEARYYFERAIGLSKAPAIDMAALADCLADWGCYAEAEALFLKVIKKDPKFDMAIRDYGRCLIRSHNPDREQNVGRAIELFQRAVELDPGDARSHFHLGEALRRVDGQLERATHHIKVALAIEPEYEDAATVLEEIRSDRGN
jgi:lipopolysaccharide biosynthesis regulator YciM